jgi:hypothetical protein
VFSTHSPQSTCMPHRNYRATRSPPPMLHSTTSNSSSDTNFYTLGAYYRSNRAHCLTLTPQHRTMHRSHSFFKLTQTTGSALLQTRSTPQQCLTQTWKADSRLLAVLNAAMLLHHGIPAQGTPEPTLCVRPACVSLGSALG